MPKGKYFHKKKFQVNIGFMTNKQLKERLEEFAKKQGLNPSIVCRQALIKYLNEHGKNS